MARGDWLAMAGTQSEGGEILLRWRGVVRGGVAEPTDMNVLLDRYGGHGSLRVPDGLPQLVCDISREVGPIETTLKLSQEICILTE